MKGNFDAPEEIGRWRTVALGIGGIAAIVILIAALIMPEMREQALRSWLLGFCLWGGIGIGSIGILLLQYLTGGAWGVVIRRILEASSRTLPIVFLLFQPILIGDGSLYGWTHPKPGDKIMEIRDAYLNYPFWALRAVLYFLLWGVMAVLLNRWSKQVDDTGDWSLLQKASRFSGPTMVFYVLLVSFAAIDWTMSLDQHWYSTIWGLLFVVGWALAAFAFVIVILAWLSTRAPMNRVVGKRHFHDLGKLVLALVMVWAYFNFSQFLIIWSGNLPEETQWYITRMSGGWGVIGVALIVLHFAFPYLVLLSRDIKRNAKYLAMLAIFILFMRLVDLYYIIGPAPTTTSHAEMGFHISWMDFLAPVAVGGIWLWWFFGELRKRPLVPINDPFLENAIEHGKGH
ncbi:MAG TPA: hypothetical protein VGB68_09320 [Pyrinomonadaceae bacterium]